MTRLAGREQDAPIRNDHLLAVEWDVPADDSEGLIEVARVETRDGVIRDVDPGWPMSAAQCEVVERVRTQWRRACARGDVLKPGIWVDRREAD